MVNVPNANVPIASQFAPGVPWFQFFTDLKREVDGKQASGSYQPLASILTEISAGDGILVDIQLHTSSGTYTKNADTNSVLVVGQAAGGGGGGVGTSSGTGRGGHGGAGETRWGVFAITGNITVTIGAIGSGGTAGNAGGTAADSIFGSLMTCKGGTSGGSSTGANNGSNGTTPSGSGGVAIPPTSTAINNISGAFRSIGTIFGAPYIVSGTTVTQVTAGTGYGAGGVAALDTGTTGFAGGNGAPGAFIVIGLR